MRESSANKRNGTYYTPEGVAAMLVRAAVHAPGDRLLDPACGDGRFLARHGNGVGAIDTVGCWRRNDDPMLLLHIPKTKHLPSRVQGYLDSAAGRRAREAYKCRHRRPWYSVPDVRVPDFFLTYMAGHAANLVRNAAGASCTNALHGVRVRCPAVAAELPTAWRSPLARLSCELEGHALGGGMLKLELKEAGRIILPRLGLAASPPDAEIEEATSVMRRWRHYAE